MGLKGAPSYFQGVLAKEVLVGLLHEICELYIDDIIVHGNTVDEFCKNVEQVFKRLKKHLIVANLKKLVLGLMEVEYSVIF